MKNRGVTLVPALAACCLCAAVAHAADLYYDLNPATADIDGGAGNWTGSNWKTTPGGTSGTAWAANDSAFFNPIIGSPATTSITLSGTQTATAVTFNGAGYTLTGGTLSLAGTGASNWIHLNADGTIASALGHLRFKGAGTVTLSGGGTITGRGVVGDGGSVLTTVRQTAGTVTISGGEYLMVGGNNVANSQGHYLLEGGALTVGQGIYLGWGAGRSGTFTQTGGTVTTQTDNQGIQLGIGGGTGYYNLNGGTLVSNFGQFGTPYAGVFTFGGGTLRAAFAFDTSRQTGVATTIAAGAAANIDTQGHTVTWSTALTGAAAAGLVKSGTGLLVLSGASSYAGGTTVNAGTIRLGNAAALGNGTGTLTLNRTHAGDINTKTSVDLNGRSIGNPIVIAARNPGVADAGALQNTTGTSVLSGAVTLGGENYGGGNGSITFEGVVSGAAAFSNSYSLFKQGAGTWKFAHPANTFDGFYYQIGGTTEVTKLANINQASSLGQPTTATANRFSFGWNGTGGGALRFVGDTASTSDRAFILQGATAAANNLIEADGTSEAATLRLTGGLSAGRSGAYTLALGGANTGDNEIAGAIGNGSGTVALRKEGAGRWILSGLNSYTGTTTIAEGTLGIGAGGTTGTLGSGSVTNDGNLAFNRSNTYVVAGGISGTGTLIQEGSGTTVLAGASSYLGATTVSQGTLLITGSTAPAGLIQVSANATLGGGGSGGVATLAGDAVLSPGSPDGNEGNHLSLAGLTLSRQSVFRFEPGHPSATYDTTPGFYSDHVTVSGALTLDGKLLVANRPDASSFDLAGGVAGDIWLIMSYSTAPGDFTNNTLEIDPASAPLPDGLVYRVNTTSNPGYIYLEVVVPEAGSAALAGLGALLLLLRRRQTRMAWPPSHRSENSRPHA